MTFAIEAHAHEAIARMRAAGTDTSSVEAKATEGGLPKSIGDTISAFANASGGLVLLGIDEHNGFAAVGIDAKKRAEQLAQFCADDMQPPVRAEVAIVTVDGVNIVAAEIPETESGQKPCFVKSKGIEGGSFTRSHDGDRHLTTYEIHALRTAHGHPRDDLDPIEGATLSDLDRSGVSALVSRLRNLRGPVFSKFDDSTVLKMAGVIVEQDGEARVTLAGLLALGTYPQQFFPQLNTTFVSYPTVNGDPRPDGTRFLDNVTIDGPIPVQIESAVAAIQRNMTRRAQIIGLGREDRWEYPIEAIREVLANALMHRDYHQLAHGTQVRIELYPDRLVITSPGGLFGPVSPEELLAETVSSSRNATLAKLLEDVVLPGTDRTVCENRGTGLLAVAKSLRDAGMEPPHLDPSLLGFKVTFDNHTIMDVEALEWLAQIDRPELNDRQRLGLAYAWRNRTITNSIYRSLSATDSVTATRELSALATEGLLIRTSGGRTAAWELSTLVDANRRHGSELSRQSEPIGKRAMEIINALSAGPRSTSELAVTLGLTNQGVMRHIQRLERAGVVAQTAQKRRSRFNKWTLTSSR